MVLHKLKSFAFLLLYNMYNYQSAKMRRCVIDIETTGLKPTDSRIVCIGTKDCETGESRTFCDQDEGKMVSDFIEYFHKGGFREVIGYNVGFDIQHIFSKILKYRIKANGFLTSNVTDLMRILRNVRCGYTTNESGRLEDWTMYLFGIQKIDKGQSVPKLFEDGRINIIIEYNRRDVEMTYLLWLRIKEAMG